MNRKFFFVPAFLMVRAALCHAQGSTIIENELYSPTSSSKARKYYNEAHDYFENRDFNKAIRSYKKAIVEDSNYIDAYDNLGLTFRQLNELDSAEKYYNISLKKYPKGAVALMNLAVVEELSSNTKNAMELYKKMIDLDPEDPEGYYGLCRMQAAVKEYDASIKSGLLAEKYYKQTNSPYLGDCYRVLCRVYYLNKDKEAARKYLAASKRAGFRTDLDMEDALR